MSGVDYSSATMWGIHGGRTGDADSIFLRKNQIALGWDILGDLSTLKPTREAFRDQMTAMYPDKKPGWYRVATGQVYRFAHEAKSGDLAIYPSKHDRRVHIGEITGGYKFVEKAADSYPHRRDVRWLGDFPRTRFSQGALYEIGSAMSFFQVKNYAEEFLAAISGQESAVPIEPDESAPYVADDIEQNTRDFILRVLAKELKGHGLAEFVAQLLGAMGYHTRVSPPGPDSGVDIIAHKDELGFVPPIIKVQVKSGEATVGDPVLSQLIGRLDTGDSGMLVTLGAFSPAAANTARTKSNLRLIDGGELVDLVLQHYDQLDSRYKGILPLRRVFVPEPIEKSEE